jgi:hypothetical protein
MSLFGLTNMTRASVGDCQHSTGSSLFSARADREDSALIYLHMSESYRAARRWFLSLTSMSRDQNAALEWIAAPAALLMLLVVLYRLLEPLAPKESQDPIVQAARDSKTAVNVWAPHGTDCKLPSGWRLAAKVNGHGKPRSRRLRLRLLQAFTRTASAWPARRYALTTFPRPDSKDESGSLSSSMKTTRSPSATTI